MKIKAFAEDWYGGIKFMLYSEADGVRYLAKEPELEELKPNTLAEPSFRLENSEAQVLMDELWRIGIRPTEGRGSAVQGRCWQQKTISQTCAE